MNFSFKNIYSQSLGRIIPRRKKNLDIVRNPERDWRRLVILFTLVLIGTIIGHILFFNKVDAGRFTLPDVGAPLVRPTDESLLKKVGEYYSTKEKRMDELKAAKPDVIDPSL